MAFFGFDQIGGPGVLEEALTSCSNLGRGPKQILSSRPVQLSGPPDWLRFKCSCLSASAGSPPIQHKAQMRTRVGWTPFLRGQHWKFTDGVWGLLHGLKRWRCSQILWKKHCVHLCPTWFEIYVVSYCSKFVVKVDFSCGGCQKLPNWVKITHQNADMIQLVRKIFYSKSWRNFF